ncbi:MAG: glutathione S-transferase family protein [SAR324 cluster bacterium]|nr:glutathione S-transferase family protein [SAR324 cluster bacterium]
MGRLIEGEWIAEDKFLTKKGKFQRENTQIRDQISSAEGAMFPPESGRYHLYVSLACPWAHRTLIMRKLKGLESAISVDVVSPLMMEKGWFFEPPAASNPLSHKPAGIKELVNLHQVYQHHDPSYTGRVTVPILWDKKTDKAVSNESEEIIRMLNSEFSKIATDQTNYYPTDLREEINKINAIIYEGVNNGVYKTGFAANQEAYEEALTNLFSCLDLLEDRLSKNRYLVGDQLTEADIRLFVTLIRFDAVYVGHFKCNLRRIHDYKNLSGFLRELYLMPAFKETTNLDHIKSHYYRSHKFLNPSGIVPKGPILDLSGPHGRDLF